MGEPGAAFGAVVVGAGCADHQRELRFPVHALRAVGNAKACLLYTSDAADERSSVDLGGRRILKKTTPPPPPAGGPPPHKLPNTHMRLLYTLTTSSPIQQTLTYSNSAITISPSHPPV